MRPSFADEVVVNFRLSNSQDERVDFLNAANYLHENLINKDFDTFDPDALLKILTSTHELVAKTLLINKSIAKAGQYRQIELFVLRNPEKNAGYSRGEQIAAMCSFLKKKNFTNEDVKNLLVAFQKFFYISTESKAHQEREPTHRASLIVYAKRIGITITEEDFHNFALSASEFKALNLFFKIYSTPKEIKEKLQNLMKRLAEDLNNQKPLISVIANFFYEFLLIKPFRDSNGRLARLFINALLHKYGHKIINLNTQESRVVFEHHFNKDPSHEAIVKLFIKLCPTLHVATKQEVHRALGEKFISTHSSKIKWRVEEDELTKGYKVSLDELSFSMSSQGWFKKQLGDFSISFFKAKKQENLGLTIHRIDAESFLQTASNYDNESKQSLLG